MLIFCHSFKMFYLFVKQLENCQQNLITISFGTFTTEKKIFDQLVIGQENQVKNILILIYRIIDP